MITADAAQAEWIKVAEGSTGALWSVDPARIRTMGSRRQAWIQGDHSADRTVRYRKTMRLISFDCGAQTQRLLAFTAYDSYGKVTASETWPDLTYSGYDPVVPDSVGEAELQAVCAVN